jgi:hypothetical protein|tara:strand:- start:673 stop:936 length:264 start_codon:yes stop_codon:yes gene_type:complete
LGEKNDTLNIQGGKYGGVNMAVCGTSSFFSLQILILPKTDQKRHRKQKPPFTYLLTWYWPTDAFQVFLIYYRNGTHDLWLSTSENNQ